MKVNVYVDKWAKSYALDADNIGEIFEKLNLQEDMFIVVRNNELITLKAKLRNGDEIRLLSVVSGG